MAAFRLLGTTVLRAENLWPSVVLSARGANVETVPYHA